MKDALGSKSLKGHLGALEVVEAATVGGETTTATASSPTATTAATVTEASATATTTAATTEATAASATTATVATAVVTSSREVDANVTPIDVLTAQTVKSSLGLLNGTKLHVSEAFGGTGVAVSGQRDTSDLAVLAEGLADGLVGRVEGKVANEQSVAGRTTLVTKLLGTSGALVLLLWARLAEVDVQSTAVKVGVVQSILGCLCCVGSGEFDVSEAVTALAVFVK